MRQLYLALIATIMTVSLAHTAQAMHAPPMPAPIDTLEFDAPDVAQDKPVLQHDRRPAGPRAQHRAPRPNGEARQGDQRRSRQFRRPMLRRFAMMQRMRAMHQFGPQRPGGQFGRFHQANPSPRFRGGQDDGQQPRRALRRGMQHDRPMSCPNCGHSIDAAQPKRDGGPERRSQRHRRGGRQSAPPPSPIDAGAE